MADAYEKQAFDSNLQEFATRVGHICSLESNGKLGSNEAYEAIKRLWKELKRSRRGLNISKDTTDEPDVPNS